jgi:hypothetical protein
MLEKRSVGLSIFLSIITCGFYALYWMAKINDDSYQILGIPEYTSGGMVILLDIVTCGIYGIYWSYKIGDRLDQIRVNTGRAPGSLSILYLLLSLFGFSIITLALAQNELNTNIL